MSTKNYANMNFFVIFSCICTPTVLCLITDSLSSNQTLSGNQTIVSSGGKFELGFFTPGKSSKYYIGIWYKEVVEQTVIWVANRDTPILDLHSTQLKILGGNLVLLNNSQITIWSTGLNSTRSDAGAVCAVLDDTGNLVLREKPVSVSESSCSGEAVWESFNYPTDTWMPGMKISYNKRTHRKQVLTSWKNSEDPATGLFSLEHLSNDSQYEIKWNNSISYWSSGVWNGRAFALVPEMALDPRINISYVNNDNESYFIYYPSDPSNSFGIIRSVMDMSGQSKVFTWMGNESWTLSFSQPRQQCEVYAYCGAYGACNQNSMPPCSCLQGFKPKSIKDWNLNDYSSGCVRETNLECLNNGVVSERRGERFLLNFYVRFPSNAQSVGVGSKGQCESTCLSNCSCNAYAYDKNGCRVWNEELLNLEGAGEGDGSGNAIYIKHSAASSVFHGSDNDRVIVGAISGSVAVLIILAITWAVIWNHRRQRTRKSKVVEGTLMVFSHKELQVATKNFSVKLGSGGFGAVYKGILPNSTVVAVKKLESVNQGEKQFRTEVSTISTAQHMNLVRLHGFCLAHNKKMLVYDYMENGSLDSHLFGVTESTCLEWKLRYHIALGVARGLAYLHEQCRERIIHCDVKPENILLDANYNPKVGDFGLAKLVGHDFSRVLTTMRGTRGYLAPEWISGVPVTAKVDVYSYGMLLFELISGNRNVESIKDGNDSEYFPYFAATVVTGGGDVLGLLDPILNRNAEAEEVARVCKVASWCIQDDENLRPSMALIVQILQGVTDVSLPPIPRSLLLMFSANDDQTLMFSTSSSTANSQERSTSY